MDEPTPDELAAIAAAYILMASPCAVPHAAAVSRWRLIGRLRALDADRAPFAARAPSRWRAAARSSYDRV
jgi:hypothetical protein